MSAPRFSAWHIVGIVAGVLAVVAVAFMAGATIGFGFGRATSRAAVTTGMRTFMMPGGEIYPFGQGGMMPYGFDDQVPYGMMEPRLAGGAYLGIGYGAVGDDLAAQKGLAADQGALVSTVIDGGPAETAGLQVGDIILALDGHPIVRSGMIRRLVQAHEPGDIVSLLILRDGSEQTIEMTLGESPD
jgi:membrane-associated protease RseP (regulator of RpoE activity)